MLLQLLVNWSYTPFWNINMIALVTVKYASNNALKSAFVDKFIDFLRTETKHFAYMVGIW